MHQSPRTRRLRNDLLALERLRSESSVFKFSTKGDPPNHYSISFKGRGLWRDRGKVRLIESHRVEIKLGSSYPRTMPEIRWVTPIYHPNISEIGMVCLGGYGTHWVPSIQLDELCVMLWDMVRYHNYDIRSPYNREAALWVAQQVAFRFPTDKRPLRDVRAEMGRVGAAHESGPAASEPAGDADDARQRSRAFTRDSDSASAAARVRQFIDRYGQIFTGGRAPIRDRIAAAPAFMEPERAPVVVEPEPVPAMQPESAPSAAAPEPAPAPPALPITAVLERFQANGAPERVDDVLILEAGPAPEPRPGLRSGDEILFIE